MLKTILIDDEKSALESLEIDLKKSCAEDILVIKKCQTPIAGLKAIRQYKPDLVFLDVVMPEMTGFELLEILKEVDFHVVFVSAFDQYALQAFEISAVHYLLKPIDKQKLLEAVERVKSLRQKASSEQLQVLLDNMNTQHQNQKIAIHTKKGYRFAPVQQIMYGIADGGCTDIYLSNQEKIFSHKALKDIQGMLPKEIFFRIHNSHIVNREYIKRYVTGDPSSIIMQNDISFNIARSKKRDFLRWMGLKDG